MGDQDHQNGEGQSDQQNQTDGQSQSNAQTPPADRAQSQGDGQSSAADSQSDTGQSSTTQQTQTPGLQAGAYRLSLTEAQRKKLVDEGVLDLSEEQYTGGVRHQIETLRKRATPAGESFRTLPPRRPKPSARRWRSRTAARSSTSRSARSASPSGTHG